MMPRSPKVVTLIAFSAIMVACDSIGPDPSEPILSEVPSPAFNYSYSGPGYDLGVTHYDCITSLGDDYDNDGFSDSCEDALAAAFNPHLRIHTDEDISRESAYAVKKNSSGSVSIAYLLAYHRDYGAPAGVGPDWILWTSHSGDSEFIIINVKEENGIWLLEGAFLSAHFGKKPLPFLQLDYSAAHGYSALSYPDNDRGRPNVWVSWGKHANYKSFDACNDHPFDVCHTGASTYWMGALNLHRNIGSYGTRFIDQVQSQTPSYYTGTEWFWTNRSRFNGWSSATWGSKATAYYKILRHFGFTQEPPAPTPTVAIQGDQQVHSFANCFWNATVSGGSPPYSYEWYRGNQLVSTSNGYGADTGNQSFYLTVIVYDQYDFADNATILVEVSDSYPYCTE